MQQLSDADLVRRAQSDDSEAIGLLFDRHHWRIFRYIRARIFDTQTAHDITGEVFLRMVANIHTFQPRGIPFTAWLYRIAHNYLADHINKESRMTIVPMVEESITAHTAVNPVAVLEQKLESEALLEALDNLKEIEREVLILRFLAGFSLRETADAVDKTVSAVKAVQFRGLKAMQLLFSSNSRQMP
ncbi:MAG: sigma-70 family RNA polymerase sigma factor [Candidatus Promineifilaceae bacterium]|nr:sigma-70 family RNA polymerase sigma factor [Candidatus Promineifilaceae bacterium]